MTSASDIAFASALDLVELYRTQALSPVEAAEALLDRAEALQPKLNAFCVIDRDGALEAARAAERRWRDGAPLGPLDGVPVTIKDLVLMRGFPTRRGSRMIDPVPDIEDGPAVARLREAGAVILGKTTTPEFGWKAIGDSPLTGITRNPWNLGAHAGRQQRRRRRRLRRRHRAACMSAATAPARSASRRPSPAFSASRRRSGGCRRIRPRRWACCRMSGR